MEHCREAENAAGRFGNVTESRLHPGLPGTQRRGAAGAMLTAPHSTLLPGLHRETGNTVVGNPSWGFNPLSLSSTALQSWCDALLIRSSAKAPGFQVAVLCSVCLRENTSIAEVTDEKGSVSENQTKQILKISNHYSLLCARIIC